MTRRHSGFRPRMIGPISEGTIRAQDTIPALADTLAALCGGLPRDIYDDLRALTEYWRTGEDPDDTAHEIESELFDDLCNAITERLPDYLYCGTHEGDPACVGIWPDWHRIADDQRCGELPANIADDSKHRGTWISISDHGNATLYYRQANGIDRELWSVV